MATSMREEIKVGDMAIRFLLDGEQSGGSVAIFEFDVPAGTKIAAAHSQSRRSEMNPTSSDISMAAGRPIIQ